MISWAHLLFLPLLAHIVQVVRWFIGIRHALGSPGPRLPRQDFPLTVILPVRNEADTLPILLSDLATQTLLPQRVIVVDDASEDGTVASIENQGPWPFAVTLMTNPGQGKKAGLSAGIRACTTTWAIGVDGDTRVGPEALQAIAHGLSTDGSDWDMALLPLRIANGTDGASPSLFGQLQALDFAAMQGWAITAVRRGKPAMASGGGWVWRCSAFPHDRLRPELPSGDDVFALAALLEDGRANRVGWIDDVRAMVSAAAMPTLSSLLDQRVRWGAKTAQYPRALKHAKRVAWTVSLVHLCGAILVLLDPWAGLGYWSVKSAIDMVYAHCVGQTFKLLPHSVSGILKSLITLAIAHPLFVATTLLVMPLRTARWKGRPAA